MGNLTAVNFGPRPCANLSSDLRNMADAVDRGEIVDLVAAWVSNGEYQMLYGASLSDSLVLSSLLRRRAEDKFLMEG